MPSETKTVEKPHDGKRKNKPFSDVLKELLKHPGATQEAKNAIEDVWSKSI